ncbi:hypothetical protein [Deinococcus sp. NW-56]|uniref:hypothetical protein n=1 Tax=Deinococcus sp. NW-56 TaxID=2080419 RepID=UPI000CF528A1|nr:hypothetical protein [Deinococcus sp. NW-56]
MTHPRSPRWPGALLVALGLLGAYLRFLRPWQQRWGATDEEVRRVLPGDEAVRRPSFMATRAVTVHAPPGAVWPWIAQLGSGRAGWYSLDWIDNAGVPSARVILPQHQAVAVGDFVPFTPDGRQGMWVTAAKPHHFLLWRDREGAATWLWWLEPDGSGGTRLLTRLRTRYPWGSPWMAYYLLYDVGDIVMMRRCLLGLKARAEEQGGRP